MPRYKLTIEYDGTPYCGWQWQDDVPTVQGELFKAVKSFSGESIIPAGAGRTDAGVHALGQVAHIDLAKEWRTDVIRDAMNGLLKPAPIGVLSCEAVGEDFDARFSAIQRSYIYRVINRRANLTVDENRAWLVYQKLDAELMHEAAQHLVGEHDFTSFRSTKCQALSPIKTIDKITVTREGQEIRMHIVARSFLHNQVRSIMGSLVYVGRDKWSVDDLKSALAAKDRTACGPVAPACGLYLEKVLYGN